MKTAGCKIILFVFLFVLAGIVELKSQDVLNMPDFASDLIIYEIATKSFTSPNGPGSGTFQSTKEKIPYLAELGINGIWLSGHNLANKHFYGIWTQYATIRQDSIDPSLGMPHDFKDMVDEAHKHHIKVFLDVVTHGVVDESPLIKEHPEWFHKGSWGMTDFDWFGKHQDLDRWWVDTWLEYVLEFGIDGFRIDCDIYRPDLWLEIVQSAKAKGKEIIIISEGPVRFPGVTQCRQYNINIASHGGLLKDHPLLTNVGKYINNNFSGFEKNDYSIRIIYQNDEVVSILPNDERIMKISTVNEQNNTEFGIYSSHKKIFEISEIPQLGEIKEIIITRIEKGFDYYADNWKLYHNQKHDHPNWPNSYIENGKLILEIPDISPNSELLSLQISCHDGGWEGFPKNDNPYSVQGSRCIMAYSGLLTPTVPIIFSGEEFDASFNALPGLKPSLFGDKGKAGDGRWLYGNVIDWQEMTIEKNREMLEDVKRIIQIRKQESDLFNGFAIQSGVQISELKTNAIANIPVPFGIWNNQKLVIVAGNNSDKDVECSIEIPIKEMGFHPDDTYTIIDLWNDKEWKIKGDELMNFSFKIKRDQVSGGGVSVFKILRNQK